jgi:ribose transport system ATP-binding protein
MRLGGQPYAPRDTREASRRGVAFIHQELNLFANLTVAENLHVPDFPLRRLGPIPLPLLDRPAMRRSAARLLAAVDLQVSPDELVADLSPGERQLLEIARAVGASARVIILDEPTTSLTSREAERLFMLMDRLRDRGVAMIYISHRLSEVLRMCDSITVLRDGQVVGAGPRSTFSEESMISLMVGRSIGQVYPPRPRCASAEPLLEVEGVTRRGAVTDISFSLNRGEVLGLSGLMGAGRTELARMLFGLDPLDTGRVRIRGEAISPSPRRCIARGMALLTEDRRAEGLLMDAGVDRNIGLVAVPDFATPLVGWISRRLLAARVHEVSRDVHLAGVSSPRQPARTLSGGNQQKVVLARWLLRRPSIFILDEPTRGIDVGARLEIYRIINRLVEAGAGVLLISSEIDELIGMSDRILVMSRGRIVDRIPRDEFDRERILRGALGAAEHAVPQEVSAR